MNLLPNTGLKASLMSAVGASALLLGIALATPAIADDPCELTGTTVTCTGADASEGVNIGDVGVTDLIINNLIANIAPAVGEPGVVLDTTNAASAVIDLGDYSIVTSGATGAGVYIAATGTPTSPDLPPSASLTLVGDVSSEGARGVYVGGSGIVTSDTTGDIDALDDALTAKSWGGSVEVDHEGKLTSREGGGLVAEGMGSDIDVTGDIDSLGDGIHSHSWGAGSSTVTITGNVNSREGNGVIVEDGFGAAAVTLTGDVTANQDGLDVTAAGDVTIDTTGDITADEGMGINASAAAGVAELDLEGKITSKGDAIHVYAGGANDPLNPPPEPGIYGIDIVSNGDITSNEGRGIYARSNSGGGITADGKTFGIRIDQTGDVTARQDAVTAIGNDGNVYVDIDGATVSGEGKGIYATASNGAVDVSVGDVTAKLDAIYASSPNKPVTVKAGDVQSGQGRGIWATSTNGDVEITASDVTAQLDAIHATTPSGAITVKAGDVVSYDGIGVYGETKSGGTVDLQVGDVTAKQDAIYAHSISGAAKVRAGDVISYSGKGVVAWTNAGGNAEITVGDVTSELDAVYAHSVSGSVTISTGTVLSNKGAGIYASADYSGRVDISAGTIDDRHDVTAELDAIVASSRTGLSVIAGDVTSYKGRGVEGFAADGDLTYRLGDVTAQGTAIHAEVGGSHSVDITSGNVISYGGAGVFGVAASGDVTFSLGDVTAKGDAINAEASNGDASVVAGNVISNSGDGVVAIADKGRAHVDIGNVRGGNDGIYVTSTVGTTQVDAGNVQAITGRGVYATTGDGVVEVNVGSVESDLGAIYAESLGASEVGGVNVTATGQVTSHNGKGITAIAETGAVNVVVDSGDAHVPSGVYSKLDAITAKAKNDSVTVTVAGDVVSETGKGIQASTPTGNVEITVSSNDPNGASSVSSKLDAITATTNDGSVNIGVDGSVTSSGGKAIVASTASGPASITVGGDVEAKTDAITAGTADGDVTVGVGGDVTAWDGKAIVASTENGNASVDAGGSIESKLDAVTAVTDSGASSVDIDGSVTSWDGKAIVASTENGTATVHVGGNVESKLDAILAQGTSSADLSVDVDGSLTSWDGKGVQALSENGDVKVDVAGAVIAGGDAITATTNGGGADVLVTTHDGLTSYTGKGIVAQAANGAVTVNSTGVVEAELGGIIASSTGAGLTAAVNVTQTGSLTSYKGVGIDAQSAGGPVTVTASGGVSADLDGIVATSLGDDGVSTVTVTSSGGNIVSYKGSGIVASSTREGVTVTNTGDITADADGISASSTGDTETSDVVVHQTGDITVANGAGIRTSSVNDTTITLDGDITGGAYGINATSLRGAIEATIAQGSVISDATEAGVYLSADGSVKLTSNAQISSNGSGILASSARDGVTIDNTGTLTAELAGIVAISTGEDIASAVNVTQTGKLISNADVGIDAESTGGPVTVTASGGVEAGLDGIVAIAQGADPLASVSVTSSGGDIVSDEGHGIVAESASGSVTVENTGKLTAELDGIIAKSTGEDATAAVNVTQTGKLTSNAGIGIDAESAGGPVTVVASGGVGADLDGIIAIALGADPLASVSVTSSGGDIVSDEGHGIVAESASGSVTVENTGKLTAELDGIIAKSTGEDVASAVNVTQTGKLTSNTGTGIDAESAGGPVTVIASGGVGADLDGIIAIAQGADPLASVSVTSSGGDIVSDEGHGIVAESASGSVTVENTGKLTAELDGIIAKSTGEDVASAVNVTQTGKLTSNAGIGIDAESAGGPVSVVASGGVGADLDGIIAIALGADPLASVSVSSSGGDIVSDEGRGIVAESGSRSVTVENTGKLTAKLGGIVAKSTGEDVAAAVSVTQAGKLTSNTGTGIDAASAGGAITITASGGVEAGLDGIVASSDEGGVTITNTGDISADGDGISASSAGDSETSDVTVEQTGDITIANGAGIRTKSVTDTTITLDGNITGGAYGINATSLQGAVEATVAEGNVISGASTGAIYINSATMAALTNRGDISSAGYGLKFDGNGTVAVDNYGTISGDFTAAGAGTFNNYLGATYNAGTQISFGGGGTFTNNGKLSLTTGAPDSAIQQTVIDGNFTQSATGRLYVDVRTDNHSSDALNVSGTASLAGVLTVNLQGIIDDEHVLQDFEFLTADGGFTVGDVSLTNPTLFGGIDAAGILKISKVNFDPNTVSTKFTPTSSYVQNAYLSGAPEDLNPLLLALVNTPDLPTYEAALEQLKPDEYNQDLQNTYGANIAFSNRLLSCRVADGPNRFKAEGDCDWFGTRLSVLDQDQTDNTTAFEQTMATLEAGTQRRIDDTWRLGGGIAFTNGITQSADGSSSNAVEGQAGVVVKYDKDALLLASALTAGYGVHSDDRHIVIGALDDTLTGDAGIAYLSARLHAAYTFELGAAYIKPLFSLDLTATRFGGVTETGGSGALTIDPGMQYVATFNPAIEIGGEIKDSSGKLIRPFLQIGLEASAASDLALAARFSGVDPSVGSMTLTQAEAEPAAKLSVGADVLTEDNATIRVFYDGTFTASSRKNSVGMKMSNNFE